MTAFHASPVVCRNSIKKALSKYIREPVVTVIVTGFNGPFSEQIRVVGEATEPKVLAYQQKMSSFL